MNKQINVWTMQMSSWRVAKAQGIEILDITAKNKINEHFAPFYKDVMEYKNGQINEEEYTQRYMSKMRLSLRQNPALWMKLKEYENVAITCFCPAGDFCHRILFSNIMTLYLTREEIDVNLKGELKNEL